MDYDDAFRVLAEQNTFETPLGHRLEAMARLRNLLIHVYGEADDERVHRYLRDELADLDAFVGELAGRNVLGHGD